MKSSTNHLIILVIGVWKFLSCESCLVLGGLGVWIGLLLVELVEEDLIFMLKLLDDGPMRSEVEFKDKSTICSPLSRSPIPIILSLTMSGEGQVSWSISSSSKSYPFDKKSAMVSLESGSNSISASAAVDKYTGFNIVSSLCLCARVSCRNLSYMPKSDHVRSLSNFRSLNILAPMVDEDMGMPPSSSSSSKCLGKRFRVASYKACVSISSNGIGSSCHFSMYNT